MRAKDWRWWIPALPVVWSILLAVLLLGPALGPGYVLSFDMVWVPDLALRPDAAGLGSGLPRAVPSDAVVAVLDELLPGALLQKLVLLVPLVVGGLGAARLAPAGLVGRLVAITLWQWNPYVVERLLIGHWPVLVGYAVLPWVLLAGRRWREDRREEQRLPVSLWWLLPLGSLSASAGLATALALLAVAAGRGRRRALVLLLAAANAPWLVAGVLHAGAATSDAAGADVFALGDEGPVPGPLAALTLGGIWNTEVVPDSRAGVLGWVALVVLVGLAAFGARAWWAGTARRDRIALLGCWVVGWSLAVLTYAAPDAVGWAAEHVPGLGLVRDGGRLLLLCAPLLVALVAHGVAVLVARASAAGAAPVARAALALAAVLAPVALLPDAAWGVAGRLAAVDYPTSYEQARTAVAAETGAGTGAGTGEGDVLLLPASSYRQPSWNGDRKVLDPLGRYLSPDYLASDVLVVSSTVVGGEDPRFVAALDALAADTPEQRSADLGALGISVVTVDRQAPGAAPDVAGRVVLDTPELSVVVLPETTARTVPTSWLVAMGAAWTAFAGLLLVGAMAGIRHAARPGRAKSVSRG